MLKCLVVFIAVSLITVAKLLLIMWKKNILIVVVNEVSFYCRRNQFFSKDNYYQYLTYLKSQWIDDKNFDDDLCNNLDGRARQEKQDTLVFSERVIANVIEHFATIEHTVTKI